MRQGVCTKSPDGVVATSGRELRINADVNGCLNIGRKELGDEWLRKLLETDEGRLMRPIKNVRIFVF